MSRERFNSALHTVLLGENECFSRLNKEGSCDNLIKESLLTVFYKSHKTLLKDISKSQHGEQ